MRKANEWGRAERWEGEKLRAPLSGLLRAMLLTDLYILLDKIIFKLLNLYQ